MRYITAKRFPQVSAPCCTRHYWIFTIHISSLPLAWPFQPFSFFLDLSARASWWLVYLIFIIIHCPFFTASGLVESVQKSTGRIFFILAGYSVAFVNRRTAFAAFLIVKSTLALIWARNYEYIDGSLSSYGTMNIHSNLLQITSFLCK